MNHMTPREAQAPDASALQPAPRSSSLGHVDTDDSLADLLRGSDLRATPGRIAVLREARADPGHFDADELFIRLRSKGIRVSKATVYRTLSSLVDAGLLAQSTFGENHAHYESTLDREHHDHLVCLRCGRVIEFRSDDIEALQDTLCRERGFEPHDHELRIFGHCRQCREADTDR